MMISTIAGMFIPMVIPFEPRTLAFLNIGIWTKVP